MHPIQLDWQELKSNFLNREFLFNYISIANGYEVYIQDRQLLWVCKITTSSEKEDFENNYKSSGNPKVYSDDGKEIVRAESRPLGTTTIFTSRGDGTDIGNGKELFWDFSNDADEISAPSGYKRKRIEFSFLDSTWAKEGTLYFFNKLKGSYIDFYVVCPTGQYYVNNNGEVCQAQEDTPVVHYGIHIHMQGDCPMGDELNTESCSNEIPPTYKFWLEITVPESDTNSNGYVTLEMYRKRSVIL